MALTKEEKIETQKPKTRPIAWVGLIIVLFFIVIAIFSASNNNQGSPSSNITSSNQPVHPSQPMSSFGDGLFIVGTDILPGTYQNDVQSGCYFARLKGFGGTTDDIIANDNPTSRTIVTIASTDKGFKSERCGIWNKIAGVTQLAKPKTHQSQSSSAPISAPVPTPTPTAPTPVPKSWHTVITYSNNKDIKTNPFSMQGAQWRITYNCSPLDPSKTWSDGTAMSMFYGYIYPTDSNAYSENFASFIKCPNSNTTNAYAKSPGQYYFDLSGNNVNYTVTVEDYY